MIAISKIFRKYQNKIDNLDLELIASRVIKKPREFVLTHPELKITKDQKLKIESMAKQRVKGKPLAYIFGEKEFYGLNFKVNKNTLIPRPETEMMVDEALKHITHNTKHVTLIDVGTGSGCIIISIIKNLIYSKFKIQNSKFFGIEISKPALQIANKNAKIHEINKKIKFLQGSLLEPIVNNPKFVIRHSSFVILANLPYLTPIQVKSSPAIKFEPKLALIAGKDGLKYYRELFKQIKVLIMRCQLPITLLIEIDPAQTRILKKIIKTNFPNSKIQIKKDLRGLDRIAIIALSAN